MTDYISVCCCQRDTCDTLLAYRDQLEDLRQKNTLAGELGQSLLARHEAYVAESQKERRRMMEKIDVLARENNLLEENNRKFVNENRDLLDRLEALNIANKDSDVKVESLSEILQSTEVELQRMNGLVTRTSQLHEQLAELEEELSIANTAVATTRDEQRAVNIKWQQAERTIDTLQRQIERIEEDAKEERQRHQDVLARMERQRSVEAELLEQRPYHPTKQKPGVVSNFVTDILQDNATLQLGITELRELLNRSNDEVEQLREQLNLEPSLAEGPSMEPNVPSLGAELGSTREIHVHHHYHAPRTAAESAPRPSRAVSSRRRSKIKTQLSGTNTPGSSISIPRPRTPSTSSTILSSTLASIPSHRLSTQSGRTAATTCSSLPSSPYQDSIFDRMFADSATEQSRPSSPESFIYSPRNAKSGTTDESGDHSVDKSATDNSRSSFSESSTARSRVRESVYGDDIFTTHSIILEENEDLENSQTLNKSNQTPDNELTPKRKPAPIQISKSGTTAAIAFGGNAFGGVANPGPVIRPTLRRAGSHESLISIHGMDIHTLQTRPSQLLLGKYVATAAPSASITTTITGTNVLGTKASPVQARPQAIQGRTSSQTYLSGIAATQMARPAPKKEKQTLTGRMGGWVFSKWGVGASSPNPNNENDSINSESSSIIGVQVAPKTSIPIDSQPSEPSKPAETVELPKQTQPAEPSEPSAEIDTTPAVTVNPPSSPRPIKPREDDPASPRKQMLIRSPGVNQPGPIWGFPSERRLDPTPVVRSLNFDALREGLEDF